MACVQRPMVTEARRGGAFTALPPSVRVERLMVTDGGESRFLNPPQVPRVPKCGTCATKRSMATAVRVIGREHREDVDEREEGAPAWIEAGVYYIAYVCSLL